MTAPAHPAYFRRDQEGGITAPDLSNHINGALVELDLVGVRQELDKQSLEWTEKVIRHAADNGAFFRIARSSMSWKIQTSVRRRWMTATAG